MAPSIKKYFIYIIFLVSPAVAINAQCKSGNIVSNDTKCIVAACNNNQKTVIAGTSVISKLDNSNQLAVELSIPKDSFAIATDCNDQTTSECQENASITASYSVLAKDIIENYKYDFSETFIDILFFENIDLARTRTI
jgi:nitrogenase subunit NifH